MATLYLVVKDSNAPDQFRRFEEQSKFYNLDFSPVVGNDPGNSKLSGHLQALINFLKSSADYCVILDSDVIISCAFKDTVDKLVSTIRTRWGVCWLGMTVNHHNNTARPQPILEEFNEILLTSSFPLGNFGYILTREVAGVILKNHGNINYFDVALMETCDLLGYPKLALKNPVVHLNIWGRDKWEIKLYENVDLALYRRDFELDYLEEDENRRVYPNNLLIGHNDFTTKEIVNILQKYHTSRNSEALDVLRTWKQKLITTIDEYNQHQGRALFYLRHIPLTIYIKKTLDLDKLPVFPKMKIKYGKVETKKNKIFVKLTQYHFIPRDTFSKVWVNTEWLGFMVETKFIKNYFYSGNKMNKHVKTNIASQTKDNTLLYHLYRETQEFLNLEEKTKFYELALELQDEVLAASLDFEISKESGEPRKTTGPVKRRVALIEAQFAKSYLRSDDELISPEFFPDLLISTEDNDFSARKRIIFLRKPTKLKFDYDIIISSFKDEAYHWVPEIFWDIDIDIVESNRSKYQNSRDIFCALTSFSENEREKSMMDFLESFRKITSVGSHHNNGDSISPDVSSISKFYEKANFVLVAENPIISGLIDWRLMIAFNSGCIPIYLGSPEVKPLFNPKAYINLQNFKTMEEFSNSIRAIALKGEYSEIRKETLFTEESLKIIKEFKKIF